MGNPGGNKPLEEGYIARAKWWIVEEGAALDNCAGAEYQPGEGSPFTDVPHG